MTNVIGLLDAFLYIIKMANKPITFVMNQLLVKGNTQTGCLYYVEFTWSHWVLWWVFLIVEFKGNDIALLCNYIAVVFSC